MDARIVAEVAEMKVSAPSAQVTTVIVIDDLAIELVSLFDAATVLAPLRNTGNSLTAVAPDFISRGGKSALAYA